MQDETTRTDTRKRTPLRRARLLRDETQTQVASALAITPSHYSRIENATVTCTPELAKRIEEYFGHSISRMQILYPEDYPATPAQAMPASRSP